MVDPIDGSVNAKRGIPFFRLLAVADGETMDDVAFGFVYDFGAREESPSAGTVPSSTASRSPPGPEGRIEILSLEGTTTEAIALAVPGLLGVATASG